MTPDNNERYKKAFIMSTRDLHDLHVSEGKNESISGNPPPPPLFYIKKLDVRWHNLHGHVI